MPTLELTDQEYELLQKVVEFADLKGALPADVSLNAVVDLRRKHLGFTGERQDTFNIILNARPRTVEAFFVSYEDIVAMAGLKGHPSVVYHKGPLTKPDGILSPGQSVYLLDGMVFSAIHTGNA